MMTYRLVSIALACSLLGTTACQSTRGRQVAYGAGAAAIVGGGALAIGAGMQEDSEGDVPFDELGVGLGIGLVVAGAVTVIATMANEPDAPPAAHPTPAMANVDETLGSLAAAR